MTKLKYTRKGISFFSYTLLLTLALAYFNVANAIDITGPPRVCPGATVTYTVGNFPSGTTHWRFRVAEPSFGTWSNMQATNVTSLTYTFNTTIGPATIEVEAFQYLIKLGDKSIFLYKSPPYPAAPNGGLVLGCSANQQVSISTIPAIQNNATDCYFHCDYMWNAPSGWSLNRSGFSPANPLRWAESITFPSGLSNGNVGQLTVTAMFSECGGGQSNTTSSATLWYGPPIISYPNQWLFDAYSNMWQLSHTTQPGFTSSYSVYSGSASLIPNANDCYVTTSDGAIIQLIVSNGCGNSSAYYFTIPAQEEMMMAYPNPAKNSITLQFKNADSPEQLPETVQLFSEKSGDAVKTISVTDYYNSKSFEQGNRIEMPVQDLARGTYYLHIFPSVKTEKKVQKIRILLE